MNKDRLPERRNPTHTHITHIEKLIPIQPNTREIYILSNTRGVIYGC